MGTHVALLRGVNVGGRNKLAMTDLRQIMESLGHREVTTYIQSGNALFTAADPNASNRAMAEGLESRIAERLGLQVGAVVLSRADLATALAGNPFGDEPNPKAVHMVLFKDAPTTDLIATVARAVERVGVKGGRERAVVVGRALYMWTPAGFGRSVLAAELNRGNARNAPLKSGTARNWSTVRTLVELFGD